MLRGSQAPTFKLEPKASSHDDARDCADLSESYGLVFDEWQQLVVNAWLATDSKGRLAATDAAVVLPRQNGKNGVVEGVELFKTTVQCRKILHTAHEVKMCRKHFLRMCDYFQNDDYPELKSLVKYIRQTNGQEAIVLKNGGSIEFIARSKSSGRGFTVDDLVMDEAQELTDEQLEALRPVISAAPSHNPQTIYMGTPTPPSSPGTVLIRLYKKAHEEKPPKRLAWFEWSVDEVGDIHDKKRWALTNPALGIRLSEEVIAGEADSFTPESFARERLGWWDVHIDFDTDMNIEAWNKCATDDPPTDGYAAYAIKFAVDGSRVSLCACLKPSDEDAKPHVELIDYKPLKYGFDWLVDWLTADDPNHEGLSRWRASLGIAIDGRAGAANMVAKLHDAGVSSKVLRTSGASLVGDSCAMFEQAINNGELTQFKQPILDTAISYAKHRPIGRSGAFAYEPSRESIDTDPLEACALAYQVARTSKRHPGRVQRAWR